MKGSLWKALFGPMEHAYSELVSKQQVQVDKEKFRKLYIEARQKLCSVENAKAGFRATGIHPFDSGKVPPGGPPAGKKLRRPPFPTPSCQHLRSCCKTAVRSLLHLNHHQMASNWKFTGKKLWKIYGS
jgi:hypothetical protein